MTALLIGAGLLGVEVSIAIGKARMGMVQSLCQALVVNEPSWAICIESETGKVRGERSGAVE